MCEDGILSLKYVAIILILFYSTYLCMCWYKINSYYSTCPVWTYKEITDCTALLRESWKTAYSAETTSDPI